MSRDIYTPSHEVDGIDIITSTDDFGQLVNETRKAFAELHKGTKETAFRVRTNRAENLGDLSEGDVQRLVAEALGDIRHPDPYNNERLRRLVGIAKGENIDRESIYQLPVGTQMCINGEQITLDKPIAVMILHVDYDLLEVELLDPVGKYTKGKTVWISRSSIFNRT